MKNGTITVSDGRTVGFADYGSPAQPALVWCHVGQAAGSSPPPSPTKPRAPAFGSSESIVPATATPRRNRDAPSADVCRTRSRSSTISVSSGFFTLGASTNGAYGLALAALSPRVIGAIAAGAISEMSWAEGKR